MAFAFVMLVGIIIFWFVAAGALAMLLERINDPYPSAKAIGILKKIKKQMGSETPDDQMIEPAFGIFLRTKGRDIELHAHGEKIELIENNAKLLTLCLLTVYPELENKDFIAVKVERKHPDLEYYAKYNGGPVWC